MQKIVFLFSALATLLFADFNPTPYKTILNEVHNNTATVIDKHIHTGASGIVLHAFDNTHETIIALATVIAKKDGQLTVKFSRYKALQQSALPQYKIEPKKGDTLILNYLYNRILPITPNAQSYQNFISKFRAYDIIHPDIFASALYIHHNPRPTKDDLRQSCLDNDNNLLFFDIDKKGYFVDCNSFMILDTIDFPNTSKAEKHPFYSRIPKITNRLGGLLSTESIGSYNRYYKKLLGIK